MTQNSSHKSSQKSGSKNHALAVLDANQAVSTDNSTNSVLALPQAVLSDLSTTTPAIATNTIASGFIAAATSDSTKRIYATDARHFAANGITVPATPAQVLEYLAKQAGQLANATLERRLNFLHKQHLEAMYPSPVADTAVRLAMRGVRRIYGKPQRRVQPLVRDDLIKSLVLVDLQKPKKSARDRLLLLMGFAGAFRRCELVAIQVEHITIVDNGLEVFLPRSKTDQSGEGRVVFLPHAQGDRCPVLALKSWLDISGVTTGFVFRAVDRHDNIASQGLSAQSVALVVKASVQRVGGNSDDYSGHSLRSGFCTQAAMVGMPNWQVRQVTGHKSDAMLNVYQRPVARRKIPSLL